MREIKFRAWVKEEYKFSNSPVGMYTGFSFKDIYSGHDEANTNCEDGKTLQEPDWGNLILMQFTGLKDRNGKEIYEGDIVKAEGLVGLYGTVEYTGSMFAIKARSGNFAAGSLGSYGAIDEVIGNVWENPELLT